MQRRLAAVMVADVVGYSRLMKADEAGTLSALKHHRQTIFDPAVQRHNGRVVKLMGDGTLVEFSSVVDAVNCALAIQRAASADAIADNAITLRIGVNLGDVIIDGDDIYGDGVNLAARLEPLADMGGICISAIVKDSIGSSISAMFRDAGEATLKNTDRPIRVWKWHPDRDSTMHVPRSLTTRRAGQARPQPSIAVLPFDNMSGDPEQQYFSDGISEDIITDLSKVSGLMVIARNSSFTYRGRSVDIRIVGRELGVTSVLEGSIRRAGNRVRISAQLIDATNGAHLWAERYDRDLTDIFALQDEVTRRIVEALKVTLTAAELVRIAEPATRSIEAHDLFLRGREALFGTQNAQQMWKYAIRCFEQAIALDPDYAEPYAGLAHAYNRDYQNDFSGRSDSRQWSAHYSRLAVEKGPELPYAHYMAALVKFWQHDLPGSTRHVERALALNPNYTLAMGVRGLAKVYGGTPLDALPDLERVIRHDPLVSQQYWHFIGSAYLVAGDYDNAAKALRHRISLSPETDLSRGFLISALGHLGEIEEARRVAVELKAINPKYVFKSHVGRLPFTNPDDAARIMEGFEKAGVPA